MRGPAPLPTSLLQSWRKDSRPNEPKPTAGLPRMPKGLSDDAKALWKNYSAQLHSLGVLTTNDATALLLLVNAHVSYLTLETEIATHGHMIRGRMGEMVRNPAVAMRNDAWKRLLKILQEFGMSPSSRTRISAIPASPESDDDRFFS